MKHIFRSVMLTVVISVGFATNPQVAKASHDLSSIVAIRCGFHDGDFIGAGVIVDSSGTRTRILTAKHVIAACRDAITRTIEYRSGEREPYVEEVEDISRDIASVSSVERQETPKVAKIHRGPLAAGDELTVVGHPLFSMWTTSHVRVVGVDNDDKQLIATTRGTTNHGDSGGGVFLADGTLAGIFLELVETRSRSYSEFQNIVGIDLMLAKLPSLGGNSSRDVATSEASH